MTWRRERRRRWAPAINHLVRTNAITRLVATIDTINPPCATGWPRLWSTLVMLQVLMICCGVDLELVGRKNKTSFEAKSKRCRIEETFWVLGRYRWLQTDHESSTTTSRLITLLATLFMNGNRFERHFMAWVFSTALRWEVSARNGGRFLQETVGGFCKKRWEVSARKWEVSTREVGSQCMQALENQRLFAICG